MSKRVDYYHDPEAPVANSLVVGSSAVVVDDEDRIMLQRRSDSGNWALPGGAMDIGETFGESVVLEVKEETCTIRGGELAVSSESTDVRFVAFEEVPGLTMHESIRKRINDYLGSGPPVLR